MAEVTMEDVTKVYGEEVVEVREVLERLQALRALR